jgi:hypothetical protein
MAAITLELTCPFIPLSFRPRPEACHYPDPAENARGQDSNNNVDGPQFPLGPDGTRSWNGHDFGR